MRICEARWLGRISYADGLQLQAQAVDRLRSDQTDQQADQQANQQANQGAEQLFLLEHPPVFTLGRAANRANILLEPRQLEERGIEVHETGRGGDVTYHGPGQIVGYPIINLKPDRCDVHRYVRDIEEVLIRSIADFGIESGRIEGLTGVWVGDEKVAAIGIRIARWITSHGFALNVNTDLSYFHMIVPCGITDKGVTSMAKLLGRSIDIEEVARTITRRFGEVFDREITIAQAKPAK